uniref:Uncharacterized protein n=1 Tax=Sander lucioperca TaxID=283035 RepID=A0A8C9XF15_SANLU
MVTNVDQCFPKVQDDVLKCLVLSTTQRYSVYCCGGTTCIHVIRPTAGLGAAARRWGTARVEDIVHRALHLTVVNGLALVGAERKRREEAISREGGNKGRERPQSKSRAS